jgi:hypothetical protein
MRGGHSTPDILLVPKNLYLSTLPDSPAFERMSQSATTPLTELAIQAEFGGPIREGGADPEQVKQEAIVKCKRRIEAARHLYEDGDLSREEYLRRKEQNEREIAHWESRTTETEKKAMELALCADTIDKIVGIRLFS